MNPIDSANAHPITEDDIANFLANNPDFFERHAALLATVQLSSGHGARAVSLQERQAELLRDKIKGLEQRVIEMMRHGQDNSAIADKMQAWSRQLLLAAQPQDIPAVIAAELQKQFLIPQAAIRVWGVDAQYAEQAFANGVSDEAQAWASGLQRPYCGPHTGQESVRWLADPSCVQSIAVIALRAGAAPQAFGALVLGSSDRERFQSDMATDFLQRIGELASAALSRLRTHVAVPQA
ncbi:MAG: DUF484 family protein [Betaproteobacteria bacterium]